MNITDAAFQVLTEAGEPLHYREIARRMQEGGLWTPTGKTPENSVKAALYVEAKRNGSSRFQFTGEGTFDVPRIKLPPPEPEWPATTFDAPTLGSTPLSFPDAAAEVLKRFGEGKPMHYSAITSTALATGLIFSSGKTPEATMRACIQREVEQSEKRGERSRFVRHGKGLTSLAEGGDH